MNEKSWKMEEKSPNWLSSLWFNSRLFTVNEFPLKFHLVGYNPCEAYEIMKIIEAYGGKFSSPDDPDVFIFCDPGYPVDAGERDLYNVKYFHDSIAALKPQELINYKIHGSINEQSGGFMDVDDSSPLKNEETIKFSESINFHHQTTGGDEVETCDEKIDARDDINSSQADDDSWTTARAQIYCRERKSFVNGLMGNNRGVINAGPPVDYPEDNEKCESPSEDDDESDDSGVSKMTDDTLYSEGAPDNNSSSRNNFSVGARRSTGGRRSKFTPTEEDNEKIVKWIMEKKLNPTDTGKKIWRDFLDEQILSHLECTPRILARHYVTNVKNLPVMKKYLETAGTSPFAKYAGPRYTEEENRVLIQYLIDKDVIHRARAHSVWKECLEERGDLLNPIRTSTNLCNYFKQKLRKNYAKYTDDPKALKQFKSIESIRQQN
ncbi:uncharacterized protein [Fopius arisanus]|uniref:Uncharacterized protein n=1 Tax=Fopius arisanus TaxID=64838 RepID=A0A9R1U1H2_9HYME|nr:PREDICTED: uncharacterized protein LOC105267172 [Fopius arisanus]